MTKIKEIFASIQGEGPYVGYKQVFVRFCGCNLKCKYCDTDFNDINALEYTPQRLAYVLENFAYCHSVSLTGGEPLLSVDFLKDFLPMCKLPVYLETNATLPNELKKVIDYVKYVSADVKPESATGMVTPWDLHDRFFDIAKEKELFAKVVFDENITKEEIAKSANLCAKYDIELILQPKMSGKEFVINSDKISEILDKFLVYYPKVRVIPQTHKFLDVE